MECTGRGGRGGDNEVVGTEGERRDDVWEGVGVLVEETEADESMDETDGEG